MDGKIAIVRCGGKQAAPVPAVLPEGFVAIRAEDLDDVALLELAAIVFVISGGRKRLPKWLDHRYLTSMAACGLKTVVLAEMTATAEQLAPLLPPDVDIYQFEKPTAACWGLVVEEEGFGDILNAEVRFCFTLRDEGPPIVPLVSRQGSGSCVAFATTEGILCLQGALDGVAECIRKWVHDSARQWTPRAPMTAAAAGAIAPSPAEKPATSTPSAPVSPEETMWGGLFRFPTLLKACLAIFLTSLALTLIPGWLRESQRKNNVEHRTKYFKTKIETFEDLYNFDEAKDRTLDRLRIPSYAPTVDLLEELTAESERMTWDKAQWEKLVQDAGKSSSWMDISTAIDLVSSHGRFADERRIYELTGARREPYFGEKLDEYVFQQNWENMMKAFRKRDFDQARIRTGILLDWWKNPHCNPIHLEHNRKITAARMIADLSAMPALAGAQPELLEAIATDIEAGVEYSVRPRSGKKSLSSSSFKVISELEPYTDYLTLAGKARWREKSEPAAAPLLIKAWQEYLTRYPDSPLYGEVLQNQMNLWVSNTLRSTPAVPVDWNLPDALMAELPRETAKRGIKGDHYLLDDMRFSRLIVAAALKDTGRAEQEIRLLFASGTSDASLRFIHRLLGDQRGYYEGFAEAKDIAAGWTPLPTLKEGEAVDFLLAKHLPKLDGQDLNTFAASDLFTNGTYQGGPFEHLLAKLFEQKSAASLAPSSDE